MTAPDPAIRFAISRAFPAPRDVLWAAWTDPRWLTQWWGPGDGQTRVISHDLRPGGLLHYAMELPGIGEMHARMAYRDLVPGELLVADNGFADAAGAPIRPPFDPDWPVQNLLTVRFTEEPGTTTVAVEERPYAANDREREAFLRGIPLMEAGFGESFDRLARVLATTTTG